METFKNIPTHPMYDVSETGSVRNHKTLRILKQQIINKGGREYAIVKLKSPIDGSFKNVSVHRLVANTYLPNPENKPTVDHIDNNGLHNNVINLRWATFEENNCNRGMSCNNTSGYKGVYLHKLSGKYMAYVTTGGKMNYLGLYETKEEAGLKAAEARAIAHGAYARDA